VSKPRILVVDIETMAAKGWFWKMFDENIGVDQVESPPRMLCWGAKFIGEPAIYQGDERKGRKAMLARLVNLVEEADAVVSYNGDKFDIPKINGELMVEGMGPLPPLTSIDLIKTVRKLGLLSNRLEFVAIVAKIGRKIKNAGFRLWRGCDEGDEKSWYKMLRYNAGDIRLTERLYRRLRPFVRNHPYLGNQAERDSCPRCSSTRSQARGLRRTKAFLIQRLQCLGCGGWFDGSREKVK
jgi:hypothetical protein